MTHVFAPDARGACRLSRPPDGKVNPALSAIQRSAIQRSAVRLPRRVHGLLGEVGELFVIALEAVRRTWDVRTWAWEFAEQAWFLARVTSIPVILVSLPLGATVALQVGQLAA